MRGITVILAVTFVTFGAVAQIPSDILAELDELRDTDQDASSAIQRAANEVDGLVALPAGTFRIEQTIVVDTTKTGYRGIRGANGATRIVMAGSGPAFRIIGDHQGTADPTSVQDHTWEKERFPVISDLEILGAHEEADGIELYRTMQCTIRNVLIRKCRYGVHLVERNRNFVLADSHIYDGGDTGVFFDNCDLHQTNIIGNHISYNKRAGIRQFNGGIYNLQMTGNDIEYNSGSEEETIGEIVLESPEGNTAEVTIASNTIQARSENHGANILIIGDETRSPIGARIVSITGNVIGARDKNILMRHAATVTITGNTIYEGTTLNVDLKNTETVVLGNNTIGARPTLTEDEEYAQGVRIENSAACNIYGNIFSKNRYGDESAGGAITLINTRDSRISDCQIIDPEVRGIHVINGESCVISDNSVLTESGSAMLSALTVSGENNIVRNNLVRSTLDNPIDIVDESVADTGNIHHEIKE